MMSAKNMLGPAATDLGFGLNSSDALSAQLQEKSDELKKRRALQNKVAAGTGGAAADLGIIGLGTGVNGGF